MTRGRIDRILDIAIGLVVGIIIGILLMVAISGCVPGGSAAACPPAYAAESAGLELEAPAEDKVEAKGERPRSPCAEEPPQSGAVGPRDTAQGPGGLLAENRTGRAARGGVSGAASARLRADAKMAQARLVCSFPPVRQALDMLRLHESVNGTQMVGDGGLAQGWLNQHEGHWNDGCEVLGVSWKWPDDTRDLAKCEMVAVGYWMRYARAYLAAGNVEELVRRFRLPFAPYRADNDRYWQKVKRAMRSGKGRSGR